jgi:uncharacterized membrane protein YagU involved in acid resistance
MKIDDTSSAQQIGVALLAGVVAAVTALACVLPIQDVLGTPPAVVFQAIASGAMGKVAFTVGLRAVWLGVVFHGVISTIAAAIFVLLADIWPHVLRHPVRSGLIYGFAVFAVMTFVIVPMSAIGYVHLHPAWLLAVSVVVHMLAFGLPISLVCWIFLGRSPQHSGVTTSPTA